MLSSGTSTPTFATSRPTGTSSSTARSSSISRSCGNLGLGVLAGAMASGGGPRLLVVEDHGTYAYFGGDCPNPPTKISKGGTKGTSKVSQARAARMQQASKQLTEAERVKAARRKQLADVLSTAKDVKTILTDTLGDVEFPISAEPTDVTGTECGFGVSFDNSIPGTDLQGRSFGASIVVDGLMTVNPFIEVDGTAMVGVGAGRIVIQARGDVVATVPLTDLDLGLGEAAAQLAIDESGARLTGTARFAPDGIAIDGNATVDLMIAKQLEDSFFHADAAISVGGTPLSNARIDVDRTGLTVAGGARLGDVSIDLEGKVGPKGVDLSGTGTVKLPSLNEALISGTKTSITKVTKNISGIESRLRTARSTVREDNIRTSDALKQLARTISSNETKNLERIDAAIKADNDRIAVLRSWIASENRRYSGWTGSRRGSRAGAPGHHRALPGRDHHQASEHHAAAGLPSRRPRCPRPRPANRDRSGAIDPQRQRRQGLAGRPDHRRARHGQAGEEEPRSRSSLR
ncbi:MAG: hypothetical protein R2705_14410 [Ilumatobacteraceae bacterium]